MADDGSQAAGMMLARSVLKRHSRCLRKDFCVGLALFAYFREAAVALA